MSKKFRKNQTVASILTACIISSSLVAPVGAMEISKDVSANAQVETTVNAKVGEEILEDESGDIKEGEDQEASELLLDNTVYNLEDGTYTIPVSILKTTSNSESMANKCVESEAQLVVENGVGKVYLTFKEMSLGGTTGYLTNAYYFRNEDDFVAYETGEVDTDVLETMTIESTMEDIGHPELVSFTLPELSEITYISMDIDAGVFKHEYTNARLQLDLREVLPDGWEESTPEEKPEAPTAPVGTVNFKDGTYEVPVTMLKTNSDTISMAATTLGETGVLTIKDGQATLSMTFKPLSFGGLTGRVSEVWYFASKEEYEAYAVDPSSTIRYSMNVDETEDVNGASYPRRVSLTLPSDETDLYISTYIDVLDTAMEARVCVDYSEVPLQEDIVDQVDEQTGVIISGTADVFPEGTELLVKFITEGEAFNKIQEGLKEVAEKFVAYDLSLVSKIREASLGGEITLKIPVPEDYSKEQLALYHISENDTLEVVIGQVEGDYYVAKVNELGRFALAEKVQTTVVEPVGIQDGYYQVDVSLLKAGSISSLSMANEAVLPKAQLKVSGGIGTLYISTKPMIVGNIVASLQTLKYKDATDSYQEAEITSSSLDGSPTGFKFELPHFESFVEVLVNPQVAIMGNSDIEARIKIDYSSLQEISEITIDNSLLQEGIYTIDATFKQVEDAKTKVTSALLTTAQIEVKEESAALYIGTKPFMIDGKAAVLKSIEYKNSNGVNVKAEQVAKSLMGNPVAFKMNFSTSYPETVTFKVAIVQDAQATDFIEVTVNLDYDTLALTAKTEMSFVGENALSEGTYTLTGKMIEEKAQNVHTVSEAFEETLQIKVVGEEATLTIFKNEGSNLSFKAFKYKSENGVYAEVTKVGEAYSFILPAYEEFITIKLDEVEASTTLRLQLDYNTLEVLEVHEQKEVTHKAYINGYADGTFKPEKTLTRAEMVSILARVYKDEMDEEKNYVSTFTDVKENAWYRDAVVFMEHTGVIIGYEGKFKPNNKVTRAELLTMAIRLHDLLQEETVNSLEGVEEGSWAANSFKVASDKGWLDGFESFELQEEVIRAEAVVIMNRVLNRIVDKEVLQQDETAISFKDVNASYWAYYDILEATVER